MAQLGSRLCVHLIFVQPCKQLLNTAQHVQLSLPRPLVEDNATIKIINHVQSTNPLVRRWLSEISTSVGRSIIETIMAHDIGAQTSIHFDHPKPKYAHSLDKDLGTICRYGQKQNVLSIPVSWGRM